MAADVRLHDGHVSIEASDLWVEDEGRRKDDGPRRAIVHDPSDGLTINYDNDYPGGLRLEGVRVVTKDPDFLLPVQFQGGLGIQDGDVHLARGAAVQLSPPSTDRPGGYLQQTDQGMEIRGARPDHPAGDVPVRVDRLVVSRVIRDSPRRTTRPQLEPVERAGGDHQVLTAWASTAPSGTASVSANVTATAVVEFDVWATLLDLTSQVQQLQARVAALES